MDARYVYVRNLHRNSYYLGVLGAYAYQLFFVGMGGNTVSEPVGVQSLKAQLRATPSLVDTMFETVKKALKDYENGPGDASSVAKFNAIYERLAALYLLLWIPQFRVRYSDDNAGESSEYINNLIGDLIAIVMSGVHLLGLDNTFLNDRYATSEQSLDNKIKAFREQGPTDTHELKLNLGWHVNNLMRRANEVNTAS